MKNASILRLVLYVCLSTLPIVVGLYVLIKKKMIVGGRLAPSEVSELIFPANLIMAISFFLISAMILTAISNLKRKNKIIEILFMAVVLLFGISIFI